MLTNFSVQDVEIVGWGETDTGEKWWKIRNSWGTYWYVS
jgi:hypothetical protein